MNRPIYKIIALVNDRKEMEVGQAYSKGVAYVMAKALVPSTYKAVRIMQGLTMVYTFNVRQPETLA